MPENNGRKEISDYIKYYTKSEDAKKIVNTSEIINNEGFDVWSFKKLIFLEYYIKPHLNILLSRGYKCYFIDFFSSCGVNKIENENITSLGSPIISLLKGTFYIKSKNKNNRFHKWFFIDKEKDFCEALKKRINTTLEIINANCGEQLEINKDIKILCGDCNNKIDEIIKELEEEAEKSQIAVLAFIDPYTFSDIEWKTWEKLLKLIYVDIIFTFPISTIKRGIPACKDGQKYLPPSLKKFCDNINDISEDKFTESYAKDMVNLVNRSINFYTKGISVKNTKNSEIYRIELFTHSKAAMEITLDIAKKLNSISALDLKSIVEQIHNRLRSLNDYQKT